MNELSEIQQRTRPDNIFLVLDARTGQDAVRTASSFDERLDISGSILTKLDGDARGGAALSVKAVTGKPIKFLGIGETLDKLEEFRPEGLASRILGFGDIIGLVQDFEKVVDEKQAEEDAKKILSGDFTMTTFLEQIRTIKRMGSVKDVFEKMPFFNDAMPADLDDGQLVKVESIILSMTKSERREPEILTNQPSRFRRIASGSGTTVTDVRELTQRFFGMRNVMKQVGKQPGLLGKLPGFKQLGMLKQMRRAPRAPRRPSSAPASRRRSSAAPPRRGRRRLARRTGSASSRLRLRALNSVTDECFLLGSAPPRGLSEPGRHDPANAPSLSRPLRPALGGPAPAPRLR